MASFVETATLMLNDQASKKLVTVNRELNNLFKTASKLKNMPIKFNVGNASSQLSKLASQMQKLNNMKIGNNSGSGLNAQANAINGLARALNNYTRAARAAAGVGKIPMQNVPRPTPVATRNGQQPGFIRGVASNTGGAIQMGAEQVVRNSSLTAGRAVLDRQSEETTQRTLGFTEREIANLGEVAERATRGMLNLTKTQALASARNLQTAGATGPALETLTRAAAQGEAALTSMFGAEQARRITESNIKVADLAGALDDPKRGAALLQAGTAIQMRGGADFNFKTFLAGLRTSGQAMNLSEEALINFASAIDEQGQRAGSRLGRLNKVLLATGATPGVAKGQIEALEESGVRGYAQRNRAEFDSDPFKVLRDFLIPKLTEKGVNLDDSSSVTAALREMGFISAELSLVASEIVKRNERAADRALAKRVKSDAVQQAAQKDIGLATQMVTAQFKDLAATGLQPFAEVLAPLLTRAAKGLEDLEQGRVTRDSALAVAGGAGVLAVANVDKIAWGVAAGTLTVAGNRLIGAAAALQRSGLGGRPGTPVPGQPGSTYGRDGQIVPKRSRAARAANAVGGAAVIGGVGLMAADAVAGGDYAAGGDVLAGAIAGGLLGAFAGPIGAQIGATLGAQIGNATGGSITRFLKGGLIDPKTGKTNWATEADRERVSATKDRDLDPITAKEFAQQSAYETETKLAKLNAQLTELTRAGAEIAKSPFAADRADYAAQQTALAAEISATAQALEVFQARLTGTGGSIKAPTDANGDGVLPPTKTIPLPGNNPMITDKAQEGAAIVAESLTQYTSAATSNIGDVFSTGTAALSPVAPAISTAGDTAAGALRSAGEYVAELINSAKATVNVTQMTVPGVSSPVNTGEVSAGSAM